MPSMSDLADDLEQQQLDGLADKIIAKSHLYNLAEGEHAINARPAQGPGQYLLMGEDGRLPTMPENPTLVDFFKCRFGPNQQHVLQSANLAMQNGLSEKMILACLLHDIAVIGFIRADHGYWGAQLIEPYVDEEVSWAVRTHQALRFFADPEVGYEYPASYLKMFGEDYQPEPYIVAEYERAKKHKWYMSARMICLNDLYSFDADVTIQIDQFEDIIGRHFRQPEEGLGNDNSPSSHMWRTLRRPSSAL